MDDIVERLRLFESDPRFGDGLLVRAAADEIERLRKIEAAAKNLISVRGRYHTEQAYKQLEELLK